MGKQRHLDIFKYGHAGEDVGDLKGTPDPLANDPVGRQPRNALPVEDHFPRIRGEQPRHHIKQRRFPGPVGSDDGVNLSLGY